MAQPQPGNGSQHLTAAQLAELRKSLEAKRDELLNKSRGHFASASASADQLSEEIDVANNELQISDALELANRQTGLLREIEAALAKFDAGTYGRSEESEEPIPFGRLQALPWARYTAQEEEVLERALRDHRR